MIKLTTEEVVMLYNILNSAAMNGMDSANRCVLVKDVLKMKPIVTKFFDYREDVQQKLRGKDFEEMQKKGQELNEQRVAGKVTMSEEEAKEIDAYFDKYVNEVNECINEEIRKKNELEIVKLSEEAFDALVAANEGWSMGQILAINEILR